MVADVGMGHETSLLCRPSGTLKETVIWAVSFLSVVSLKIVKNNCKPGKTHRKTPFIHPDSQ